MSLWDNAGAYVIMGGYVIVGLPIYSGVPNGCVVTFIYFDTFFQKTCSFWTHHVSVQKIFIKIEIFKVKLESLFKYYSEIKNNVLSSIPPLSNASEHWKRAELKIRHYFQFLSIKQ